MERAFKLEGGQRHHDDATSAAAWVEEMRGMGDDNVVLYYKPQGADDNKTGLKREDFLIVLQTPVQAKMFKKFAEGKVVCVDATQGTNAYEFKLITLLVVRVASRNRTLGTLKRNGVFAISVYLHAFCTILRSLVALGTSMTKK